VEGERVAVERLAAGREAVVAAGGVGWVGESGRIHAPVAQPKGFGWGLG